jgi:hypothetical protein
MKTLNDFQNDVKTFFKKYESDYIKNKDFHSLYYGDKVFFSPVKQYPLPGLLESIQVKDIGMKMKTILEM